MNNNRFAIVVASDTPNSDQDAARKDIAGLEEILKDENICSFGIQEILDEEEKNLAETKLKIFFEDRHLNDTLLIYFSCHGTIIDESIWLLMRKSNSIQIEDIKSYSIELQYIKNLMDSCVSERQILIIDCCLTSMDGIFPERNQKIIDGQLTPNKKGQVILTACDMNQGAGIDICATERTHSSSFTRHFIDGIISGDADLDDDGHITISDIYEYARKKVMRQNGFQNPRIYGQSHDICVARNQNHEESDKELNIEEWTEPFSKEQKELIGKELAKKYKTCRLKRVRIADSHTYEKLGITGAEYLNEKITHNDKIALSCGRTLFETLVHMERKTLSEITIYPLSVHPSTNIETVDSNVLTALCMAKLLIADNETKITAYRLPLFIEYDGTISESSLNQTMNILSDASKSDIFLLGIGNPLSSHANISRFFSHAEIDKRDLKSMGAKGEILYHLYDEKGQFLLHKDFEKDNEKFKRSLTRYYEQFATLDIEYLEKISNTPGVDIIAIAGGKDKRFSILGAIRAGLIRTLITDGGTARWLLKQQPGPFEHISLKGVIGAPFQPLTVTLPLEPLVCPVPDCDYRSRIQVQCPIHKIDLIPLSKKGGQ